MKGIARAIRGWNKKREFVYFVTTTEQRILRDIGITQEMVQSRVNTPFWKF